MSDILERPVEAKAGPDAAATPVAPIENAARDWYKDAVIYQLHVKAFQDANSDGIGDFEGLMQRLDYIESLGVTAIWILPFYPSPLRDDGYDIAKYTAINPSYGDMRDFRRFVAEAHRRNIRVITELVINHTSDQHPWFQKARKAKPGSVKRDFYVWSDTDQAYAGTRIIFIDTEKSNWTWDPVANAYYFHRFYSHQPDLNFDNPRVLEEVLRVMHFWLDMGVDGLRLDAIPYLIEREGTNNENLPETHEVLKKIRADLDAHYPDRMLLAEANQWPEDTRPYFGEGDECHMAFHFPLMPRMYMAVAQEDRHPITDIIRQTPDIPDLCQWAIFLRNHDELTLEMVTAEERDYLWRTYAKDRRARINLGIRRRLAPLMENDRRKIELMNALLLSMPGTPVLYYGDELGMGDNYYLGDRDAVRTPMQWSTDRNGGFSRADPQALYLPAIMDALYGYQAVNVESQQKEPASLLNWTRRMVGVRKQHRVFGRGAMSFLYPPNRKILAYVRRDESERILCVANLSRQAQAVELDLSEFKGAVPVELTGGAAFPPVGDLPYLITLPAYGFFWFLLAEEADAPRWHKSTPEPLPEFITLVAPGGKIERIPDERDRQQLERYALPEFLARQRWFAGKSARGMKVGLAPLGSIPGEPNRLAVATVAAGEGEQRYFMPFSVLWGEEHLRFGAPKVSYTVAKLRRGSEVGAVIDAAYDERFVRDLVDAMRSGADRPAGDGIIRFEATEAFRTAEIGSDIHAVGGEQSNVSMIVGDTAMLKIYRRLRQGRQPEIEVAKFLTETGEFSNTPAFLGSATYVPAEGEPTTLAAAFAYARNQGDAWGVVLDALERHVEEVSLQPRDANDAPAELPLTFAYPLDLPAMLGRRTAELHAALAMPSEDEAFSAEPVTSDDITLWVDDAAADGRQAFADIERAQGAVPEEAREDVAAVLDSRTAIFERIEALRGIDPSGLKTRIHGDYHLGQVLVAQGDVMIIDFEGEPQRSLAERREKTSGLRDAAGMLRSFDYAAWSALERLRARHGPIEPHVRARAFAWRDYATLNFLNGYWGRAARAGILPENQDARRNLLQLFLFQKAFYEVGYEAAQRPAWLPIPVRGLLELLRAARPEG